jgi:hypothetical protein
MAKQTYFKVTEDDGFTWYSMDDPNKAGANHEALLKCIGNPDPTNPEVKKLLALADTITSNDAKVEALTAEEVLSEASRFLNTHNAHNKTTSDTRKHAAVCLLQSGVEASVVQAQSGALYNHMLAWVGWTKNDESKVTVSKEVLEAIKALKKVTSTD